MVFFLLSNGADNNIRVEGNHSGRGFGAVCLVADRDAKRALVMRDAQHEYVFVEVRN